MSFPTHRDYTDAHAVSLVHTPAHTVPSPTFILDQQLLDLLRAGRPSITDQHISLNNIVYDSLREDGASPAIVFGDQTHYRMVFIHAATKHVFFADPLDHHFPEDILEAFKLYHMINDTINNWTYQLVASYPLSAAVGCLQLWYLGHLVSQRSGYNLGHSRNTCHSAHGCSPTHSSSQLRPS